MVCHTVQGWQLPIRGAWVCIGKTWVLCQRQRRGEKKSREMFHYNRTAVVFSGVRFTKECVIKGGVGR